LILSTPPSHFRGCWRSRNYLKCRFISKASVAVFVRFKTIPSRLLAWKQQRIAAGIKTAECCIQPRCFQSGMIVEIQIRSLAVYEVKKLKSQPSSRDPSRTDSIGNIIIVFALSMEMTSCSSGCLAMLEFPLALFDVGIVSIHLSLTGPKTPLNQK